MHFVKHAGLYLVLVGLPCLGLALILRVGAGITPPPRVAGAWTFETGAALACAPGETLTVEQSGRYLRAPTRGVEGTVDAERALDLRWSVATGSCAGRSARWRGRLEEGRLEGRLAVDGCGQCDGDLSAVPTE